MFLTSSCFWAPILHRPLGQVVAAVLVLVMLVMGVTIVLHRRTARADLRMDVAQVRVVRLVAKRDDRRKSTSRGNVTYSATFEQVGVIYLTADRYEPLVKGHMYRVTYSPHTRHGWHVEPAADGRVSANRGDGNATHAAPS